MSQSNLTSIIISTCDEKLLGKTMESCVSAAAGPIEFVIGFDGCSDLLPRSRSFNGINIIEHREPNQIGRRKMINRLQRMANGEYFYQVDAHCAMSKQWDVNLKKVAGKDGYAASIIVNLFRGMVHVYKHICLTFPDLRNELWEERPILYNGEPMPVYYGCSCLYHRDLAFDYNESYSGWGWMGVELGLRAWLCGAKPNPVRLCHTAAVTHVSRRHRGSNERIGWKDNLMSPRQTSIHLTNLYKNMKAPDQQRTVDWLIGKFPVMPGWEKGIL